MFEKEAKEYVDNNFYDLIEEVQEVAMVTFKDSAEFGYNKGKEDVKTAILKLRNCMNCKYRDTKGHSSCKDKGIVLCSHWEMKE